MVTKTVQIYTSDLTGREIGNDGERVELRVLDHPDITQPVRLDAYALEVQQLFDATEQYVAVEVVMLGQQPQRLMVSATNFARIFTTDVTETLHNAERLSSAPTAARGRRGATANRAKAAPRISREQRGAVREWANNNGYQVGDRGRIKADIVAAFEAAHNLTRDGDAPRGLTGT